MNKDQTNPNLKVYIIVGGSDYDQIYQEVMDIAKSGKIFVIGVGFACMSLVKGFPVHSIFGRMYNKKMIEIAATIDRQYLTEIRDGMKFTPREWRNLRALRCNFVSTPDGGGDTNIYDTLSSPVIRKDTIDTIMLWMAAESVKSKTIQE